MIIEAWHDHKEEVAALRDIAFFADKYLETGTDYDEGKLDAALKHYKNKTPRRIPPGG
jgi:hypothetical protein